MTGDFRTENVGARLCPELIVVVHHHRPRTGGIGVVHHHALGVRFHRLCGNFHSAVVKTDYVAHLGKIRVTVVVEGKHKAAYGNIGAAVPCGVYLRDHVVCPLRLTDVFRHVALSARGGIGVQRRVHYRIGFVYRAQTYFVVGKIPLRRLLVVVYRIGVNGYAVLPRSHRNVPHRDVAGVFAVGKCRNMRRRKTQAHAQRRAYDNGDFSCRCRHIYLFLFAA